MRIYNFNSFVSRSRKLVINIMKTLELNDSTIERFKKGGIVKTDARNPIRTSQGVLSNEDEEVIAELSEEGLLIYHVILTTEMMNKKTIIESEVEVSTFDSVTEVKYYLFVPSDLAEELKPFRFIDDRDFEEVIKDYIIEVLNTAREDFVWAYIFFPKKQDGYFGRVKLAVFNGNPIVME
ncbi:hypothetical protein [Salipaludibacillus sp. CF4.18]|uniref:hypothetical protein n=1 Tax=Salipaludibacillus sp. CF4.18 TaxID=3373081 RepID=UPI003EE6473E